MGQASPEPCLGRVYGVVGMTLLAQSNALLNTLYPSCGRKSDEHGTLGYEHSPASYSSPTITALCCCCWAEVPERIFLRRRLPERFCRPPNASFYLTSLLNRSVYLTSLQNCSVYLTSLQNRFVYLTSLLNRSVYLTSLLNRSVYLTSLLNRSVYLTSLQNRSAYLKNVSIGKGRAESRRKEEESMLFCLKQQTCHQGVMWFDDCN
ncbi:unnamed protein product [Gadus morhua 'NCC']